MYPYSLREGRRRSESKGDSRMNAIIYTRFSPRKKADESESCEIQEAYCREYCNKKGYKVIDHYPDPDVSGADEYRQQLWNAIEALDKDCILVVYKRDRLARNVYLSEQINRAVSKQGARIEAVSGDIEGDSPEVRMIRQVLASVAEYERQLIRQRTSHAMRAHQKNGRKISSNCPYGWEVNPKDEKQMQKVEAEQQCISIISNMRKAEHSWWEIAAYLNQHYQEVARGKEWYPSACRKIYLRDN
jgi:site-specific DNA recombinase